MTAIFGINVFFNDRGTAAIMAGMQLILALCEPESYYMAVRYGFSGNGGQPREQL